MRKTAAQNRYSMRRLVGRMGVLAGLATSLAVGCGGDSTPRINFGGESHFLVHCNVDDTCAGGLACISGVCTLDCSAGEAICSELSPLASCGFQSSEADARAVCDIGCSEDSACAALGDEHRCENGSCRAPGVTPSTNSTRGTDLSEPLGGADVDPSGANTGETAETSSPVQSLCADNPVLGIPPAEGQPWRLKTQEDVEALEGCEEIPVSLSIEPSAGDLDLRPLHALKVVGGVLWIDSVASLEGLEQVLSAESLWLQAVGATSLRPLSRLRFTAPRPGEHHGELHIENCDLLEELDGLDSLTDLQRLLVRGNRNLRSLGPLPLPPSMQRLDIRLNPALLDLGAVTALESVAVLDVQGNEVLEQVALNALRNTIASEQFGVESRILIALNPGLESIGLGALESAESVIIQRNKTLRSLDLRSLAQVSNLVIGLNLELRSEAITLDPNLPADLLRVGGNGPGTGTGSPVLQDDDPVYGGESYLEPCPFTDDGHCDACFGQVDGVLDYFCLEELCVTDPVDCSRL